MLDTTCANYGAWKSVGVAPADLPLHVLPDEMRIGVVSWEEHCVECGQPECFKTCRMFQRSYDGKCRRFKSGIVPFSVSGRLLHGVSFKKWAKIEGAFHGSVTTVRTERRWAVVDRLLSACARTINRLMAFVPGRIGAITVYRRFKLWGEKFAGRNSTATMGGLVLTCRASCPVKLHFAVIQGDESVHDEIFQVTEDWQTFTTSFRPVGKGTRFLFFSTEVDEFDLFVDTLEILPEVRVMVGGRAGRTTLPQKEPAKYVKCLAWDLDNTLWKGILVEDGADKLVLNEEAVKLIKTLDQRGIINTVLSKNDHEAAWKVLEKFGLAEYFVFPTINWLPKSANLDAAAKTINIGLDTFAFVDDSPFERGEVGEKLPMVRVFKNTEIAELAARPEFNPPVSGEGSKRRLSYQKEMQRVAAAQSFAGDYAAFLRSCEIVLTLFSLKRAETAVYERCYELIQRTNQLTLAGRRYTPEQFAALVAQDNVEAWGIRCQDKFGDYGIVGVAVARRGGATLSVEEFVMSCRVAKKQCEYSVVWALAKRAEEQGAAVLRTRIVKTGRNTALVAAFDEMPFVKTSADGDKAFDYELDLEDATIPDSINKAVFK